MVQIYDQGQAFAPSVLDIEESQLLKTFAQGIATIASIVCSCLSLKWIRDSLLDLGSGPASKCEKM